MQVLDLSSMLDPLHRWALEPQSTPPMVYASGGEESLAC